MQMNLDSLMKLFVHELKDLHSAEAQQLEALPGMVEAAQNDELKAALKEDLVRTRKQRDRIEKIFESLEFEPGGHRCRGMEGILTETQDLLSSSEVDPEVRDAALIGAAQRIEHYEIAGYGTASAFAAKLGKHDAVEALQESLDEEAASDTKLTRLAERSINFQAMDA